MANVAQIDEAPRRLDYQADPWLWIRETVWTVDEVDKVTPIKRFPVAACLPCRRYAGGDEGIRYQGPNVFLGGVCKACEGPLTDAPYFRYLTRAWQAAGNHRVVPEAVAQDLPVVEAFTDHPPIIAPMTTNETPGPVGPPTQPIG